MNIIEDKGKRERGPDLHVPSHALPIWFPLQEYIPTFLGIFGAQKIK